MSFYINNGETTEQRSLEQELRKVHSELTTFRMEEARAKRALEECQAELARLERYLARATEENRESDIQRFSRDISRKNEQLAALQAAYDLAASQASRMQELYDSLTAPLTPGASDQ